MKKSARDYIVFPLDFPSIEEAKSHIRVLGDRVGMFKIGLELFIHQGPAVIRMVRDMSPAGIFLDLKLHDICATVFRAMGRVADLGVELATVHCSSSVEMLKSAVQGGGEKVGVLGVTLLTDNDGKTLAQGGFQEQFAAEPEKLVMLRAKMALDAGCKGVVCSGREAAAIKAGFGRDFLAVTPGIRPAWSLTPGDDQKRITTPEKAIAHGSDLLVIGRPVRDAKDPAEAVQKVTDEIETALANRVPV